MPHDTSTSVSMLVQEKNTTLQRFAGFYLEVSGLSILNYVLATRTGQTRSILSSGVECRFVL